MVSISTRIDATSGSLGHGLGIGAGYALSFKKRKSDQRTFVILSEGELYEGSIWESLLFVKHHQLDNLHIVLDRNDLIILGNTESCLGLEPIDQKFAAFGFNVQSCDGHDFNAVLDALDNIVGGKGPGILIADTVKGKGLSLMEDRPEWHYWNPLTEEQIARCRAELR